MSFFGDILTAGDAAIDAITGSSPSPATSAPVPAVPGGPPSAKPVPSWTAPDASGSGQISVHRDVLRSVAKSMQSDLKDIDAVVAAAQGASGSAGSISGWSTGNAFSGNASNTCHAIAKAGTHAGNAQQAASKNLTDCASTYDAAESDNQQAISGVGTPNAVGNWGPIAGTSAVPATPTSSVSAMTPIDVKTHSVAESDVTGMTAAGVMEILHGLPSGEVAAAGATATRLGSTLERIATQVTQHAHTLAQNWTGSAAQGAMVQFQALHDQTAKLAQQTMQTGAVLSWLGNEVLPRFKALPDPTPATPVTTDAQEGAAVGEQVAGPGGAIVGSVGGTIVGAVSGLFGGNAQAQAEADRTAQQYLKALNTHLIQANEKLPSPVGGSLPYWGGGGPGAASPSGGARSGAGAAAPGSGYASGGTGGMTGVPQAGSVPGAGGSGSGAVPGAPLVSGQGGVPRGGSLPPATGSLQGVPVTPGGSPSPSLGPTGTGSPVLGPAGPGTGSPVPGLSGLPVPGPASGGTASGLSADDEFPADAVTGGGIPGGAVPGEEVAGGAVPGEEVASVPEVSGLTAQGAVGQGAAVQGAAADTAVGTPAASDGLLAAGAEGQTDYGMTGFPMMGSGTAQQEKERRRKAWLGEDADIWGLPSDHIPPVIEGGD
jgi:hypothetical protein